MTEKTCSAFSCDFCDSVFTRSYNLRRHVERKHPTQNVTLDSRNVNLFPQNVTLFPHFVTPVAQNVTLLENKINCEENTCINCNKVFANKWTLKRHNINCNGPKDPQICSFCNRSFNTRNGKSKHIKICKTKNTALIVQPSNSLSENTSKNDINSITNNITIGTQNNINTTNNFNIVIYDQNRTNFVTDHITKDILRNILLRNMDDGAIRKYSDQVMQREENNCIRKLDKRSSYSQVHIGENKWKNVPDKIVYPEIVSKIAEDMQDRVSEDFSTLKSKEKLFALLDYIIFQQTSDDDTETERRYKRIYNLLLDEQKLYAINSTRLNAT